ncbi:MAG: hypothetical protein HC898_06390 [Phycisphaerales bacterium]|nr:hypothetical protein [Phycisphaerales bacterium]
MGKETEVDKSVLELLGDPLIHILRNSADHGIEKPELRKAAGKSEMGTVRLAAQHQGSHVRVESAMTAGLTAKCWPGKRWKKDWSRLNRWPR